MQILVTGAAGFIGMHLCQRLLANGHRVLGIDNLNPYYDVSLKQARLKELFANTNFSFQELDICNFDSMLRICRDFSPEIVLHLAAQAGVRYSMEAPFSYVDSNLRGFVSILEVMRNIKPRHFIFG
jgi:UDP-glucuronate 4-epimerase